MRTPEGRTETTQIETEEKPLRTEEERDYENIEESRRRKAWMGDLNSALESLEKLEKKRGEAVEQKKDKDIEETDIDRKIKTERESIKYLVESITGKKIGAEINTDQEIAKRIFEEGVDAIATDAADTKFREIVQERGEEWEKICAEVNQKIKEIKQGMDPLELINFEENKGEQKLLAERLLEIRKEEMRQEIRTEMIEKIRDKVKREEAMVIWLITERTARDILAEDSLTS